MNAHSLQMTIVVTRCHAALLNPRTGRVPAKLKDRVQCDQPAKKGIVLCKDHDRPRGRTVHSVFGRGVVIAGSARNKRGKA